MLEFTAGSRLCDGLTTNAKSPLRIRKLPRNANKTSDEDQKKQVCIDPEYCLDSDNARELEVAGNRMLGSNQATQSKLRCFGPSSDREKKLRKLSLWRGRNRLKTDSAPFEQERLAQRDSKQYNQNLQLIRQLLERCNIKYIEGQQLDKLVSTYGLKIESLRYNIVVRPKATSVQTEIRSCHLPSKGLTTTCNTKMLWQKELRKVEPVVTLADLAQERQAPNKKRSLHPKSTSGATLVKLATQCAQSVEISSELSETMNCRLKKFREFLFVVNMTNRMYRPLEFEGYANPIKYWVGCGNNSQLVRSILKKRFWMVAAVSPEEANFVWTQIKITRLFAFQASNTASGILEDLVVGSDCKPAAWKQFQADPIPAELSSLVSAEDMLLYQRHLSSLFRLKNPPSLEVRARMLHLRAMKDQTKRLQHNHLPNNGILGNKKALYYVLKMYCKLHSLDLFSIVPKTFHVKHGLKDPTFQQFVEAFKQNLAKHAGSIWIVKPGEHTNRGTGILCCGTLDSIKKVVGKSRSDSRTYIIQEYITNPLLYHGRKFDIRMYMLMTVSNGLLKCYWYREGYVRTASSRFELKCLGDPLVHLTNDAIQKEGDQYGRYEEGNKLSLSELSRYIKSTLNEDFFSGVLPRMKKVASQCAEAAYLLLDPDRKVNNFELFGLDFMLDERLHPWLLEINTNPCLELCCGVLSRLIPAMLENVFRQAVPQLRIAVDPQFPPPSSVPWYERHNISENPVPFNKLELVFDELRDGSRLKRLYAGMKLEQQIGEFEEDQFVYGEQPTPF